MTRLGVALLLGIIACKPAPEAELSGRDLAKKLGVGADSEPVSLDRDAVVLRGLRALLPPRSDVGAKELASRIEQVFPAKHPRLDPPRALGFGWMRHEVELDCGTTCCSARILSLEDVIAHAEVSCVTGRKSYAELKPFYAELAGGALFQSGSPVEAPEDVRIAHFLRVDEAVMDAAKLRVATALGPRLTVDVPEDLADEYEGLTSPWSEQTVGFACGAGGSAPEGKRMMDRLVAAKRDDLLRDALRGPSPEGRVYAALGLKTLDALGPDDMRIVEVLLNQRILVESCGGCRSRLEHEAEFLIGVVFPGSPPPASSPAPGSSTTGSSAPSAKPR